jgi:hypothetical protein
LRVSARNLTFAARSRRGFPCHVFPRFGRKAPNSAQSFFPLKEMGRPFTRAPFFYALPFAGGAFLAAFLPKKRQKKLHKFCPKKGADAVEMQ